MKKKALAVLLGAILAASAAAPALAGEWKNYFGILTYTETDEDPEPIGDGWHEVDGKQYYFYDLNKALRNSVTPDGYVVGEDGAWIEGAKPSSVRSGKTLLIPGASVKVPAAGKLAAKIISYAYPAKNENGSYGGALKVTVNGKTTEIPLEEESYGYRVWAADLNPEDSYGNLLVEVLLEEDDSVLYVFSLVGDRPVRVNRTTGLLNDFEPDGDGTLTVYRFDRWGASSLGSFGRKQTIFVNGLTAKMTESSAGMMRFDTYSFQKDYVCTAREKIVLTDRTGKTVTGTIEKGEMFLVTEAWDADTGNGEVWYRVADIKNGEVTGWNRHLIDPDNPLIEGTGYAD